MKLGGLLSDSYSSRLNFASSNHSNTLDSDGEFSFGLKSLGCTSARPGYGSSITCAVLGGHWKDISSKR